MFLKVYYIALFILLGYFLFYLNFFHRRISAVNGFLSVLSISTYFIIINLLTLYFLIRIGYLACLLKRCNTFIPGFLFRAAIHFITVCIFVFLPFQVYFLFRLRLCRRYRHFALLKGGYRFLIISCCGSLCFFIK